MNRALLAAAGLALLVPAALAQTAAAPAPAAAQPGMAPPPPPGGPHGPGMMPPPPPPRGAHFHIEKGDARVDVKCADEDSTRACADIVNAMIDRLGIAPAR